MRTRISRAGFSAFELIIVLAVVSVLGFVGYTVYNIQNDRSAASQSLTESVQANDVANPPGTITSTKDLDKAAATVDETDPGGSNDTDASELDAELNNF